jgi:hypothetical protein
MNTRKVVQDPPDIKAIEIVEVPMENNRTSRKSAGSRASSSSTTIDTHWCLKYKGRNANFFVVNPREDPSSEHMNMLTYGEGNRTKNFEDERYINLFKKEREFL